MRAHQHLQNSFWSQMRWIWCPWSPILHFWQRLYSCMSKWNAFTGSMTHSAFGFEANKEKICILCLYTSIEVFRNEILAAWQKYLNVEVILISEFVISEMWISSTKMSEEILISEFLHSEIRITSTFRPSCQADRISFRKTSNENIRLMILLQLVSNGLIICQPCQHAIDRFPVSNASFQGFHQHHQNLKPQEPNVKSQTVWHCME